MSKFVVRPEEVPSYSPAAHQETVTRRLIGKENVGAVNVELVLGETKEGGIAEPHFHEVEQIAYLLEGKARVEVEGVVEEIKAGDVYFAKPGVLHQVSNIGGKTKWLVVYSPPLGGSGDQQFKKR